MKPAAGSWPATGGASTKLIVLAPRGKVQLVTATMIYWTLKSMNEAKLNKS